MTLKEEKGKTIQFYKTKMVFKTTLEQTNNQYSIILMTHPPLIGPALHFHPHGPESFYVIEGSYTFILNGQIIDATQGDFISIPQHAPHRYVSGPKGGKVLVTTPASVETYFLHIAEKIQQQGDVSREYEFEFAKNHGQIFLDASEHWGHK